MAEPGRAITAVAPAPGSARRRCRLTVNGLDILDVDSYSAGLWVTTLSQGTLVPKQSTFYPVVINIRDGVARSRTPDDENCSMVPGANALAGWLKWPNEPDDLIVVQSSGDLRGHITTALVEQLEAYGGRRISKIFETHNAETNHVDEEDADEGFAFVLVGRHGLGYGMGHQVINRGREAVLQILLSEDSWASGRLLEGLLRNDCYATIDTFSLPNLASSDQEKEGE